MTAFVAYRRLGAMPTEDDGLIGQRHVLRLDGSQQLVVVAVPEVRAAYRTEQ